MPPAALFNRRLHQDVIAEIRQLSARLHENTKFEKLTKYGSANLYYLVADAGVLAPHELPADWGWLRPAGDALELVNKPIWHDVDDDQRLEFLHRIAVRATRAAGVRSEEQSAEPTLPRPSSLL